MNLASTHLPPILLSPPHLTGEELFYVQEAFAENWVAPAGPHLRSFEQELGQYLSVTQVLALSSGTASLHLTLAVLGVKTGDIVFCQSLTFVASANPILYQGGIPVFIDSERESWNMCPEALETALRIYARRGKLPKAVIVVHLFGMPAKMKELLSICGRYGVPLVEDAAEALGSLYNNQDVGTIGDIGFLSFNGNKIITTSSGGALLTNEKAWAQKALFLASQAKEAGLGYHHLEVGYNYRMSNICAGIGRAQLLALPHRVQARRRVFDFYQSHLKEVDGLSFQPEAPESKSNRWLSVFIMDPELMSIANPENICFKMLERGIETRRVWKPMHLQPLFADAAYIGGGVSEALFRTGLCLPSGSALTTEMLQRVMYDLLAVFKFKKKDGQ